METYKHVLFAIDLHPDCDTALADKASAIAKAYGAKLSMVHAIEAVNSYGATFIYPAIAEIESQMADAASEEMTRLCKKLGIKEEQAFIEVGSPKNVIMDVVEKCGVDLILVGSHGRHGLQRFLGSTAQALLHAAPCDVLVIKMHGESH